VVAVCLAHHYRLGDQGAVLVRPDGYLAWRNAHGIWKR
jgi:hypothetical protein